MSDAIMTVSRVLLGDVEEGAATRVERPDPTAGFSSLDVEEGRRSRTRKRNAIEKVKRASERDTERDGTAKRGKFVQDRYYPEEMGPDHAIFGSDQHALEVASAESEAMPEATTHARFGVGSKVVVKSESKHESGWLVESVTQREQQWFYNLQRANPRHVEASSLRKKSSDGAFVKVAFNEDFEKGSLVWYAREEGKEMLAILESVGKDSTPYYYQIVIQKPEVDETRLALDES